MTIMTAAAIDLGTNTFHLIIAKLSFSGFTILHKRNEPVKLGEGRLNENIIIPEAFERGIKTLQSFRKDMEVYGVDIVKATATSAVRSARNGADFVAEAKAQSGIQIEVISGDKEAEYIFEGVKGSGVMSGQSLIVDIGGGSTEFILCDEDELLWKQSFDIGAARLMQAYFHSDPINEREVESVISHLDEILPPLFEACRRYKPTHLIGSAGAFESFAALIEESDPKATRSGPIDMVKYQQLSRNLIASTHQERTDMPALIPLRVDMIVMAAILTSYILERLPVTEMSLSTFDLKMGVLSTLNKQIAPGKVSR